MTSKPYTAKAKYKIRAKEAIEKEKQFSSNNN